MGSSATGVSLMVDFFTFTALRMVAVWFSCLSPLGTPGIVFCPGYWR